MSQSILNISSGSRFLSNFQRIMSKSILSVVLVMLLSVMGPPPQATAKPTFVFGGFNLASFVGAGGHQPSFQKRSAIAVKPYTGMRITNNSLIMIYWFDQTVAIAELGPKKLLLSCELIEVNNDEDRDILLNDLSKMNRPLQITFSEMLKLMTQCQQVDGMQGLEQLEGRRKGRKNRSWQSARGNRGILDNSPLTLLSGIIPGTKWCGTGDIAESYHDLGPERPMDRCCRTHDLCPVKVRAFSSRYNLTNNSIYSKSHCLCDDELFACLKETNTSASQLMGNIYFNLVRVPCLEDDVVGKRFREAKQGF